MTDSNETTKAVPAPRSMRRDPKLRTKRGRCYVSLSGQDFPCGPAPAEEANRTTWDEYQRQLVLWKARGRQPIDTGGWSVATLVARYLRHLKQQNGEGWLKSTGGGNRKRYAVRSLVELYGSTPASEFGPLKLQALRKAMLDDGSCCRDEINLRISAVKLAFKWGVSVEEVPAEVLVRLETVKGLGAGEFDARDNPPREDVAEETVLATLPFMPTPLDSVIRLMLLTGARSKEIRELTPDDIDRSDPELWVAMLTKHKTAHRGKPRVLVFDEAAQRILAPFLLNRPADRPLFRPAEHKRRAVRKRKLYDGDVARYERKKAERAAAGKAKVYAETYDHHALLKAVGRALTAANRERQENELPPLPRWTPHQIRHTVATTVATKIGDDEVTLVLGHSSKATRQRYIHNVIERTKDVVKKFREAS